MDGHVFLLWRDSFIKGEGDIQVYCNLLVRCQTSAETNYVQKLIRYWQKARH